MVEELTTEERAIFDEIENGEKHFIRIPSRTKDGSEEMRNKLRICKRMVYKNLLSFDIDFDGKDYIFLKKLKNY